MTQVQQQPKQQQRPIATNATPAPQDAVSLLKSGGSILLVGILSAASIYLFFGGASHQGPHTNAGWLALIIAMMCLPFGLMLFALGAAKYFSHRHR